VPSAALRLTAVSATLALTGALAGCSSSSSAKPSGSSSGSSGSSGSASSPAVPTGDPWKSVTIAGTGKAPTITLGGKPFAVAQTTEKVVTPGKGATLTKANGISANYVLVDGKSGKQLDSSFGKTAAGLDLSSPRLMPGLAKGLIGQRVGSRVLVGIPPAEAFGPQGNAQLGVAATDSVIFLVDVVSAVTPLTTATGTAVAPKKGLPAVQMHGAKAPSVTIPKTNGKLDPPPTSLVVQQLVKGKGVKTRAGQSIKVNYHGVVWGSGNAFDSSYTRGEAATFPIGVKQVISGWDKGLVGQPVGSRVLLVVPPAEGYGPSGGPKDAAGKQSIGGKDTLVFVVDILSAI
jgi:peptidylprolyl isomerase